MPARRLAVLALAGGLLIPMACSKGQALRVTTTAAVKSSLKDHNVNYHGDITCRGDQLPIDCSGQTTDGRPISATLTVSSGRSCLLLVTVAGKEVTRTSASRCK